MGHCPKRWEGVPTGSQIFPNVNYSYMDSFEKFDDTSLPSREKFYNDLSKEHISDDDYNFIHDLWLLLV